MKNILTLFLVVIYLLTQQLAAATVAPIAQKVTPLLLGSNVPKVTLKDHLGKPLDLHELCKDKGSLIVFYRGSWCPYCNRQLQALGQSKEALNQLGIQIIAISPDGVNKLNSNLAKNKIDYSLLSDSQLNAAKAFGIAFNSGRRGILPVPAVFLYNTKGVLEFQYVNPNYKVRLDKAVLMAAAKAASK